MRRATRISAAFAFPLLAVYLHALFLFALSPKLIPHGYLELAYANESADRIPGRLTQFWDDPLKWEKKSVLLPGPSVVWRWSPYDSLWGDLECFFNNYEPISISSEIYLPVGANSEPAQAPGS